MSKCKVVVWDWTALGPHMAQTIKLGNYTICHEACYIGSRATCSPLQASACGMGDKDVKQ